jgi:protein-S-isoprenylcysteine O-methyltransferase Ste14
MIEIKVTSAVAFAFIIYGLVYVFYPPLALQKKWMGITAIVNGLFVILQCWLMYLFYVASKEIVKADKKE